MWRTSRLALCLVSILAAGECVRAQQQLCQCQTTRPFADCVTRVFGPDILTSADSTYQDEFPGSGTIVAREGLPSLLYIADLFSGRAYAFQYETVPFPTMRPLDIIIPSPGGSLATTGITFVNGALIWAVTDSRGVTNVYQLWRTDTLGGEPTLIGTVNMASLANLVRQDTGDDTIVTGAMGGIAYHQSRGTLWAVDIVNDLYFELQTDGQLALDGDGRPIYFFNPLRNHTVGGAYGNDLTYVANAAGEFFDIPVGRLSDGRPSRVTRVRATAGPEFEIGDETGVLYALGENLQSPQFVTGIIFWRNACAMNQHSEFLLGIDLAGGPPRVTEISADDPTAGTVAGFSCRPDEADLSAARLTWGKDFPYTSLEITRRDILQPPGSAEVVFTTSFDDDPGEFFDGGLLTGTYEYTLTAMNSGNAGPQTCRVNIGRGRIDGMVRFAPGSASALPYAATIASNDTLIVADLESGQARTFDLALNPQGELSRPSGRGLVTGMAYNADDGLLYRLRNDNGSHFLSAVNLATGTQTAAVRLRTPSNVQRGLQLGDITYDRVNGWFWSVDLLRGVILPFQADGFVPLAFRTAQLSLPNLDFSFTGGLALVSSSAERVTFDLPLDDAQSGRIGIYARVEFDLTTRAQTAEAFRFDLASAVDTGDIGSLAVTDQFAYVVSMSSGVIFRVIVESEGLSLFRRGDVNDDGLLNISDPSALLGSLFLGQGAPACMAAADANSDVAVTLADAVFLFSYLFGDGEMPGPPFPNCGTDTTTTLSCDSTACQ